jgi:acyl dehydratase/NADP-dependent 3-hydroxy acid dehydrogenase YdfG
MSRITLAVRTFEKEDQHLFADLSGDLNPIHLDPIAARRSQAGGVVVHGIHAGLWALDKLVEAGVITGEIASLKVQFTNFIEIGKQVELVLLSREDKSLRAVLCRGKLTTISLLVTLGTRKGTVRTNLPNHAPTVSASDEPANFARLAEMAQLSGWLGIPAPVNRIQRYFPNASSAIGASRAWAIALLSTLVGMICPGLYSLFAGFTLDLVNTNPRQDSIGFQVIEIDERFRMVRMNVFGAGIDGVVQAFLRWPPVAQAALREIMNVVAPTEFADSTALIIGGSRGLGALTAKIIAAGGGKVVVTYEVGQADAESVIEEIRTQTSNRSCRALRYNVHQEAGAQLKHLNANVTHLYYFATGPIARQKDGPFAWDLFDEFIRTYVKGFYDCCSYLSEHVSQALTVFYPSSVFVESNPPEMTEYSMAKMAGELLCDKLNRTGGRTHIIVKRLPRLLTDQTATVLPMARDETFKIMLPVVRNVQSFRLGA